MNQATTKICQNCNQSFQIEPEDFVFYDKIQVPPPTFCFDCKLQRRLAYRNERALYKRECGLCGENIIAGYSKDNKFVVYCQACWYSDKWDAGQYGKEYDFSRPFFQQWAELLSVVPMINLVGANNTNSEYTSYTHNSKQSYLSYSTMDSENILYSRAVNKSLDCVDCLHITSDESCYQCIDVDKSYNSAYLTESRDCINSKFLFDATNCNDCFMAHNTRSKSYIINGAQYTKEEYQKEIEKIDTGSYKILQKSIEQFSEMIKKAIHKYASITKSNNSTGEAISNSRDARNCFYIFNVENAANIFRGYDAKDIHDANNIGGGAEIAYEGSNIGLNGYNIKFSLSVTGSVSFIQYSSNCHSSSNLFACIGLRNKQYCILNKQYTKEEYEQLVPKIIEHMNSMPFVDKNGKVYKYGEFFPTEFSPFAYNETIAQEYFPLTKQQAIDKGYKWKDPEEKNIQTTIKSEDLPDHIKDVKDDIIKEIIECQHKGECNEQCTKAFKIIPQELEFYKKMNLPLLRLCPNCRHYQRLKQRNPLKLWKRQCQCSGAHSSNNTYQNTIEHSHQSEPCSSTFETTYSPDRPEIVYCEQCYQQEVV